LHDNLRLEGPKDGAEVGIAVSFFFRLGKKFLPFCFPISIESLINSIEFLIFTLLTELFDVQFVLLIFVHVLKHRLHVAAEHDLRNGVAKNVCHCFALEDSFDFFLWLFSCFCFFFCHKVLL